MHHEDPTSPARPCPVRRTLLRVGAAALSAGVLSGRAAAQTAPQAPLPLPIPQAPAAQPTPVPAPGGIAERQTEFAVDNGRCAAVLVASPGAAKLPGLVLVPDSNGLAPQHVRLARKLAGLGHVVLVPNFPSVFGTGEDRNARAKIATLSPQHTAGFLRAATAHLGQQPAASGAVGLVALGWGGGGFAHVAADPGPVKTMVLLQTPLPADQIAAVKIPLQFHYAGRDEKLQPAIDACERRLIGHSKVYEQFVYEDVQPGFLNELDEKRYNEKAATLALGRIDFFLARYLPRPR